MKFTLDKTDIQNELMDLFEEELEVEIPSAETDLMEIGYLDSLSFVHILAVLEDKYDLKIDIKDLEFEYFKSIENIAEFIGNKVMSRANS